MSLKTFIIQESLRAEHAERFILYQERYNTQIFLDLKNTLAKDWEKEVTKLSKSFKIQNADIEYALLQNQKSTIELSVVSKDEKITTTRHRESIEISPSAKIPMLYKNEERDLIIKSLLDTAEITIKNITDKWREIFRVEKKGRAVPWFKIIRDKDEIRFQLALSESNTEMYRTLYTIRVEYAKSGSKLRDFDRVYLLSLI